MQVQGWSGVILVGNGHVHASGWELAERIRTFDAHVPVILLGHVKADPTHTPPAIQACLPEEVSEELLLKEVERESSQSICNILDVSATNLRVLLFRARTKLRTCLETKWEAGN